MTSLDVLELRSIIRSLVGAVDENDNKATGGRFQKLHEAVRSREAHFFNSREADQKLPPPHDDAEPFQSDVVRQSWVALKGRLTENPYVIRIDDEDLTPSERTYANEVEAVLQAGLNLVEERERVSIQGDLADGQIVQCSGVLHWRKATEVWPSFPDPYFTDDPAGDKAYRSEADDEDEDDEDKRPVRRKGKYRETDENRLERDKRAKSRTFPWHVEIIRMDQCAWVADNSSENGLGLFLVLRDVPFLEYSRKLKRDGIVLSVEAAGGIKIGVERDAPSASSPSGPGYREGDQKNIYVCQVWDRDCFYELASYGGGDYQLVKEFDHPYGMPPFALVPADEYNHPDPVRNYLPAAEGLFRLKPFFDHDMTLGRIIAEQTALPFFYIKQADGAYMTDNEGKTLVFTRNALAAQALPAGATVEKIEFELNPAFVQFLEAVAEELENAKPETGTVEVGASTQPYTLKLAQEQANPPVKQLKANQAAGIRVMARNMLYVMSLDEASGGFGRPVPVAVAIKEKGKVRKRIAEIEPGARTADLVDLVEVDINPLSAAQNVTNIEFARQLAGDPNVPYTKRNFAEEALNAADPDRVVMEADAETLYYTSVYPVMSTAILAQKFGKLFYMTPDGGFVNGAGSPASPEQVLGANGISVQPGPSGAPPTGSGPLPPTMNPSAPLQVPDTFAEPALM